MDLYREHILDHYRNPRGWGKVDNPSREAQCINPLCGDTLTIQLVIEKERIKQMHFTGHGCAISIATASMLSDFILGKTIADTRKLNRADIESLLGTTLPPARIKCGLLALETAQMAIGSKMTRI